MVCIVILQEAERPIPGNPPRAPGRPRNPAADAAILRAAIELFLEHGLAGANIGRIAHRAGVARATIYRRWPNQEALMVQAIRAARGEPPRSVEEVAAMDLPELAEFLLQVGTDALARPELRRLATRMIGLAPGHPKLMAAYWTNFVLPWRRAVIAALNRARIAGVLPASTDAAMLLDMVAGAIAYRLLLRPEETGALPPETFMRRLLEQAGLTPIRP